ncbi:cytidylyltransferase [Caulobacter phage Cr30]|uniref:cytidyltransferase n=1 Tax=Caulobacter phage Cr30 TaxID=1357714 RepID=UPI0004A9BB70|nr:cytidyltransferase [Caulobacter phage Cr30]AGS80951.1 cytidylyltransferase [Caulobacter phage Cr30]
MADQSLLDKIKSIMWGDSPALNDRLTNIMWGYSSKNTATGDTPNSIDLDPKIPSISGFTEHVAFTFGRFSIPHKGHGKLFEKLKEEANGGDFIAFASLSNDSERNPLVFEDKAYFVREFFNVELTPARTLFEAIENLQKKYKSATFVVGEDRFVEFKKLLEKYSDQIEMTIGVVSVDRSEDDYSATNLREAVLENDFVKFDSMLPESADLSWNLWEKTLTGMNRVPSPQDRPGSEYSVGSDVNLGNVNSPEMKRRRSLKKFRTFVDIT